MGEIKKVFGYIWLIVAVVLPALVAYLVEFPSKFIIVSFAAGVLFVVLGYVSIMFLRKRDIIEIQEDSVKE